MTATGVVHVVGQMGTMETVPVSRMMGLPPMEMSVAQLSSLAIVTATVVFLLAFLAHAAEWAAVRGVPVRPDHGDEHDVSRQRSDMWARLGYFLLIIGALAQTVGDVARGIAAHRFPWGNMYEWTTAALWFLVVGYLVMAAKGRYRWLGLFVSLLLAVGDGAAATVFYVAVGPLVPALHSVWFVIHVLAGLIAGAAFNVGGLASIGFLIKAHAERKGTGQRGYMARMPSSESIDTFAYRLHAFAFPVWTFTIAAGAIWAEYAWGRFWGWDPKETWALITWVVYAGYLHARSTAGWRGTRAAIIALVGLGCFWFNFIGVNLFVTGLHSYAGV